MLNSIEIEKELKLRGFWLEYNNTHALGYRSPDNTLLIYIKTSRSKKDDDLTPVYKQPLVLHWSTKSLSVFDQILDLVGTEVNLNYQNHNMTMFNGPSKAEKHRGIAIDIVSSKQLNQLIDLLTKTEEKFESAYEDIKFVEAEFQSLTETTKKILIDARLGQGQYRQKLISLWGACSVTGCGILNVLRASHIKPWRLSDNDERLDKHNGLLLTPNLDQAFDQGLISFDNEGKIIIKSGVFSDKDLEILNINSSMKLSRLLNEHRPYLEQHRKLHKFE